jgi:hypothetical protein
MEWSRENWKYREPQLVANSRKSNERSRIRWADEQYACRRISNRKLLEKIEGMGFEGGANDNQLRWIVEKPVDVLASVPNIGGKPQLHQCRSEKFLNVRFVYDPCPWGKTPLFASRRGKR